MWQQRYDRPGDDEQVKQRPGIQHEQAFPVGQKKAAHILNSEGGNY
jgi:hypothetical protein